MKYFTSIAPLLAAAFAAPIPTLGDNPAPQEQQGTIYYDYKDSQRLPIHVISTPESHNAHKERFYYEFKDFTLVYPVRILLHPSYLKVNVSQSTYSSENEAAVYCVPGEKFDYNGHFYSCESKAGGHPAAKASKPPGAAAARIFYWFFDWSTGA
ncbi:hypothetical protein BDV95DRAFT_261385 [Massariosphaeria phaeospora]|uniref:Uncharacterized protein n=1 Tax=Massariosphaeria phaeospora TaxID=100035 RepID=A0A7C8HYI3_9PLEO|nr:hypothetical protein BDV95DRAFT_261385 [Massariosphaeria phaeospora]